jgi:hypothetical protein
VTDFNHGQRFDSTDDESTKRGIQLPIGLRDIREILRRLPVDSPQARPAALPRCEVIQRPGA